MIGCPLPGACQAETRTDRRTAEDARPGTDASYCRRSRTWHRASADGNLHSSCNHPRHSERVLTEGCLASEPWNRHKIGSAPAESHVEPPRETESPRSARSGSQRLQRSDSHG